MMNSAKKGSVSGWIIRVQILLNWQTNYMRLWPNLMTKCVNERGEMKRRMLRYLIENTVGIC